MAQNSISSQKQIQSPATDPIPQIPTSSSSNPAIVTSPSLDISQQKMQQAQNLLMQRSSSFNQVQGRGQQQGGGMLGQSIFGSGSVMSQQQQQQQMNVGAAANMGRAGLMGQMLQGQLNMQSHMLVSPWQNTRLAQGAQYQPGNMTGKMLQGMQSGGMSGSLNVPQQMRDNGALNYMQQRMNQGQVRQQLLQQNPLNAQQQQWLKQMPGMNTPASPSYCLQQQRQHQLLLQQEMASSAQMNQNPLSLNQQQLNQLVQTQSTTPQQQQHHQQQLAQQVVANQQQQSPQMVAPNGQKTFSLAGSQPDASGATTPGGSSSQGTEVTNQLLGKRKIQDLVSQVDLHAKLDPEVEDILLEIGDSFIESVTTFAITLAKHRNSSTLEAKDLLLHLEKNWNLKIPGYSSEGQKNPSRPASNDIHKKRLDMIRTLMESSQPKGNVKITKDASAMTPTRGMDGQYNSNHHLMRSSPSSEQLVAQSISVSQMLHQHQLTHF